MSTEQLSTELESTSEATSSLLEQAIGATKQTDASRAEELLKTLTEEALKGTVQWNKNMTVTFNEAIQLIDQKISKQLSVVMHSEEFQKLEGSWRGLHHLVMNSETSSTLKIRMLNMKKKELHKDLSKAVEFDQSQTFKKIYESEFGTPGGEPYGTIVGDFEFTNHPEDVETLSLMSNVAAAGFCPFIAASSPSLFGFDNWEELTKPRDLEKVFESLEYTKWRSFRDSDDSRFVSLTMPRFLSRLPYGAASKPVEEFNYEEFEVEPKDGRSVSTDNSDYCWSNAAYAMATNMTKAFAQYGFCTAIRGAEGGGKVEGLPTHIFTSDDGDPDLKCPTEIGITDRREAELSKLGFLPLCHYKNTDYAVFFGGQSCQKPQIYSTPDATANAAISARLPYLMATSRFAHYLKVMARDKIGSFMEAEDVESWLNRWILSYVNATEGGGQDIRARYPLADAKVSVKEIPGQPGAYNAVAWLRPWLQMEELTSSLRLVAKIPEIG
ncbi:MULTISPECIES: type VI secretion system contractile sheath large subunit [Pseudoalteromonas]|jgi:type VI secretion system protein ImpC|uniref:Type VI secretion protein T6SSi_tssC n=1 Tax=Pseudoalteromonas carrageenovora IAM 12662 TaxID=1314868 RepID=A0A2K4XEH1_PSEVC|nr:MULTISPECIES: type VI secretion system contractile sheath large subunit [Pseudoalteromonas]KTF15445.1 EvpB family type VI secretion protein [Pseudoalteromonas sp. H103]MBB1288089.1 type VI secretion system contractile sheath large subunit [Pseudoalteromonas sp. SR41-5]MBB1329694.1 type VI secretion system contractile sheath large subunit [Pseudoalteromonas sp. SR43-7]MBB1338913.1 type VI secretion system contractile sheath large subunit [Pseudoalteromonas sp. SR44-2]MBB1374228.1 type VI sec|tara:strand:- start:147118 stop:148608 length:1491 start_codon:yes stop_codon:yes gene_type:complete